MSKEYISPEEWETTFKHPAGISNEGSAVFIRYVAERSLALSLEEDSTQMTFLLKNLEAYALEIQALIDRLRAGKDYREYSRAFPSNLQNSMLITAQRGIYFLSENTEGEAIVKVVFNQYFDLDDNDFGKYRPMFQKLRHLEYLKRRVFHTALESNQELTLRSAVIDALERAIVDRDSYTEEFIEYRLGAYKQELLARREHSKKRVDELKAKDAVSIYIRPLAVEQI